MMASAPLKIVQHNLGRSAAASDQLQHKASHAGCKKRESAINAGLITAHNLKIVQHNMNGQQIVAEQLRDYCARNKIDVILAQEPPLTVNGKAIPGLDHSPIRLIIKKGEGNSPAGAAIIILNPHLKVLSSETQNSNVAAAIIRDNAGTSYTLISAYFKFNRPTESFIELMRPHFEGRRPVIAGIDSNAHSKRWFSEDRNARGVLVEEFIDDNDLHIANIRHELNTYDRPGMGRSNIDITITKRCFSSRIQKWDVLAEITDSDHRVITFEVSGSNQQLSQRRTRYNTAKADWTTFGRYLVQGLHDSPDTGSIHERTKLLNDIIVRAADKAIPRKHKVNVSLTPPWWTRDLTESKRKLARARREAKARGTEQKLEEYKVTRN